MTQFFGLSADQLTATYCEHEVKNVTSLSVESTDTHELVEGYLDGNHTFGAFWRQYGNDASNLVWMHLPEFDRGFVREEEGPDQHDRYPSIIGLGDDDVSALVQDIMLAEAKAYILRSVTTFFGQTIAMAHVTHNEEGRHRQHRSSCRLTTTGDAKLLLAYEESAHNELFGARCYAIVRYIRSRKLLDRLQKHNVHEEFLDNQTKLLAKYRSACGEVFASIEPPRWNEKFFVGKMVDYLKQFGITSEHVVKDLLEGEMPEESFMLNAWRAQLTREGGQWQEPLVTVRRRDCDPMVAAPESAETIGALLSEAEAVIEGFQKLTARFPDIRACARSFNRPINIEP